MKKGLIILIFLPFFTFAQQYNDAVKEQMQQIAKKQIRELHDGCLLVRLHKNEASVNALLKAKKIKAAEKMKGNLDKMNHNIVSAFSTYFDFCRVYFFYAENSDSVLNKDFTGIILDSNFQITDPLSLKDNKFFVAEICKTVPDTLTLTDNYKYMGTTQEKKAKQKTYYESSVTHMNSLVIKSDKFIQLSDPFPFYSNISFTNGVPNEKKINRAVYQMNIQLHTYYR